MASSSKTEGGTRVVILHVRVTTAEKLRLLFRASEAGMCLSDWMRTRSLDTKPLQRKPGPDREALLRLLAGQGKIGSNVNQVARALNRRRDTEIVTIPDAVIQLMLQDLKRLAAEIREALDNGH